MTVKKTSKWTDELIKQLEHLYLVKKISTVEIAKELGFTKNAIIGKVHRLKLQRDSVVDISDEIISDISKLDFIEEFTEPVHFSSQLKEQGTYSLEEIEIDMCIWPYDPVEGAEDTEFTFCGKKTIQDKQYCAEHFKEVYLTVKKSTKVADNVYTAEDMEEDEATDAVVDVDDDV